MNGMREGERENKEELRLRRIGGRKKSEIIWREKRWGKPFDIAPR